jgi:hypothetical protein
LIGVRGEHARVKRKEKVFEIPLSQCWGVSEQGDFISFQPEKNKNIHFSLEVASQVRATNTRNASIFEVKIFEGSILLEKEDAYLVKLTNRSPRYIGEIMEVRKEHVHL